MINAECQCLKEPITNDSGAAYSSALAKYKAANRAYNEATKIFEAATRDYKMARAVYDAEQAGLSKEKDASACAIEDYESALAAYEKACCDEGNEAV